MQKPAYKPTLNLSNFTPYFWFIEICYCYVKPLRLSLPLHVYYCLEFDISKKSNHVSMTSASLLALAWLRLATGDTQPNKKSDTYENVWLEVGIVFILFYAHISRPLDFSIVFYSSKFGLYASIYGTWLSNPTTHKKACAYDCTSNK